VGLREEDKKGEAQVAVVEIRHRQGERDGSMVIGHPAHRNRYHFFGTSGKFSPDQLNSRETVGSPHPVSYPVLLAVVLSPLAPSTAYRSAGGCSHRNAHHHSDVPDPLVWRDRVRKNL